MLQLKIELEELFNEATDEFEMATVTVELEHSLLSLSKWEAKYEKPFLSPDDKSPEEILDYVTCMIVTPNFNYNLLDRLSESNFDEINKYISSKQSATWFAEDNSPPSREVITAELIYYWIDVYKRQALNKSNAKSGQTVSLVRLFPSRSRLALNRLVWFKGLMRKLEILRSKVLRRVIKPLLKLANV